MTGGVKPTFDQLAGRYNRELGVGATGVSQLQSNEDYEKASQVTAAERGNNMALKGLLQLNPVMMIAGSLFSVGSRLFKGKQE